MPTKYLFYHLKGNDKERQVSCSNAHPQQGEPTHVELAMQGPVESRTFSFPLEDEQQQI